MDFGGHNPELDFGGHRCLFYEKTFLTLLFAIGNIAAWGGGHAPLLLLIVKVTAD